MTTPTSMRTPSENDDPYIDEDGNFLANEQIVSDIDDDMALGDEEYHETLLGYGEARDLMKEARVARGFYSILAEAKVIPQVSKMCGKAGRGKGGRGSKGSGRDSDSCGPRQKGQKQRTLKSS